MPLGLFTDFFTFNCHMKGSVVYANPPSACTPVDPPPNSPEKVNWILLARRSPSECGFQKKIENAQNAGMPQVLRLFTHGRTRLTPD